jgi:putative membrane protein
MTHFKGLTLSRILFLGVVIVLFKGLFDILVLLFNVGSPLLNLSVFSTFSTLTFYFTNLEMEEELKPFLWGFMYPFVLLFSSITFFPPVSFPFLVKYTVTDTVGIVLAWIFLKYINFDLTKLKVNKLLKAFLINWLSNDYNVFEREIQNFSVETDGWIKVFGKRGSGYIIQTSFHPGPLRNIGGGVLIESIFNKEDSTGVFLYTHTATQHSLNPATHKDVSRITECLNQLRGEIQGIFNKSMGQPILVKGVYFNAMCIPFENTPLVIISKNGFGPDDMPFSINQLAEDIFTKAGFQNVLLIDSHNSMPVHDTWKEEYLKDLKFILKQCASRSIHEAKEMYQVGFGKKIIHARSVCDNGIRVVIFKSKSITAGIVMIDGNNMDRDFKKDVINLATTKGVEMCEVITTDNHTRNATGKYGDIPVGNLTNENAAILKAIDIAMEEALMNMGGGGMEYFKFHVPSIQVMGEEFFRLVEKALKTIGRKAILLFIPTITGPFIISLALSILG